MYNTEKYFTVQYKDWLCSQIPYCTSASGYAQYIENHGLHIYHHYYGDIIIRSTKRQLYRYLKWYVDSGRYKTMPNTYEQGDRCAREVPDGQRLRRRRMERRRTPWKK